mmetsp:Transcript_41669/g.131346  ORF Transcript_41669/g.131346 Transcript_41669/m.131346 type:complete len:98 (+) Transcript_41669:442-735(+)
MTQTTGSHWGMLLLASLIVCSGKLEFEDFKKLLTDLNDGIPPSDQEVKQVMDKADGKDGKVEGALGRMDILYAVGVWYSYVDHQQKQEEVSSCCSIS